MKLPALTLLAGCLPALAAAAEEPLPVPAQLPPACQAALEQRFPDWQVAQPPAAATAAARSRGWNPVVASADFDGDGQPDWATLGRGDGTRVIVLCRGADPAARPAVLEDEGCSDSIHSLEAGTALYDVRSGESVMLDKAAITTSCQEKSGRTFLLDGERFRVIEHEAVAGG